MRAKREVRYVKTFFFKFFSYCNNHFFGFLWAGKFVGQMGKRKNDNFFQLIKSIIQVFYPFRKIICIGGFIIVLNRNPNTDDIVESFDSLRKLSMLSYSFWPC